MYLWNVSSFFSSIAVSNFSIVNSTSVKVVTQPGNFILYDLVYSGFALLPYQTFSKVNASAVSSFANENNIVADGAFVLQNYTANQNPIVLTANPYYWQGKPHFQTLQYYLYSSLASELNAYEAGQIDACGSSGPYSAYQPIANLSGHTVVGPPLATPGITMGVLFNDWNYPFNNSLVRQALAWGTNVSAINAALNGRFSAAALLNQDNLLPAYNQQIGFNAMGPHGYSYNVSEAKKRCSNRRASSTRELRSDIPTAPESRYPRIITR